MRMFDTTVQKLKHEVLRALIKNAYEHDCDNIYVDIPKRISPGPKANHRCCIYKERAVLQERIRLGLGGDPSNPNVVEVIDIACDECPIGGMLVTDSCRGCIVHRCMEVCPKDAVSIVDRKAVVDKEKCIECGKCVKACPFNAIVEQKRPCVSSCKINAIKVDSNRKAVIDNDKCIHCGACVFQCPFGAISDKSFVMDAINILKASQANTRFKTHAMLAPAIVSQFKHTDFGRIVSAVKALGFDSVWEAALGADITLQREAAEWAQKRLLTSSCCPSFVDYIQKHFPKLADKISHNPSPMIELARYIKSLDPKARVVFVGPCVSKKHEFQLPAFGGAVDCVLSFEELQAFFDARNITPSELEPSPLDQPASTDGRLFGRSGGLVAGLQKVAAHLGAEGLKPVAMNGIEECRTNLLKLSVNRSEYNFFEGMACEGGCAGGALCLNRNPKGATDIDKHANLSPKSSATQTDLPK